MGTFKLLCRDVIEALKPLPPDLFHGCLCDPPYGLSSDGPQDFAERCVRILPKIGLPKLDELEPGLGKKVDLASIPLDGSDLSRRKLAAIGIEPRVSMPVGAVHFEDAAITQEEINTGDIPSAISANADLSPVTDTEGCEFLGDYVLDLRDARDLTARDVFSSDLCQATASSVRVSVVVSLLPGRGCPLSGSLLRSASDRCEDIGTQDDARGKSSGAPRIVASGRAEARAVLRFDVGLGALELRPTSRAGDQDTRPRTTAKLIRALPRAGGLPAMAESHLVRLVGGTTDGTGSVFRLWLRAGALDHFAKMIPSGGFMGKQWDHGVPGVEYWREIFRVLKPGAPILAFGGSRTYHRLACAIEDAGFEIFDSILGSVWITGQGFPKSLDISKALDKSAGAARRVVGISSTHTTKSMAGNAYASNQDRQAVKLMVTAPATDSAKLWDGYGTALKPAWEPIVFARKPLSGTYAENCIEYGCGGLNIDGSRIAGPKPDTTRGAGGQHGRYSNLPAQGRIEDDEKGRYPANLILSHHPECEDAGGCRPECPVAALDRQSGHTKSSGGRSGRLGGEGIYRKYNQVERAHTGGLGDYGGASRFFQQSAWAPDEMLYCAKVSTAERNAGGVTNSHATLKPLALTTYLAKLILPPLHVSSRLLVPFCGTGSEIAGALIAGWGHVAGIDNDPESISTAQLRILGLIARGTK